MKNVFLFILLGIWIPSAPAEERVKQFGDLTVTYSESGEERKEAFLQLSNPSKNLSKRIDLEMTYFIENIRFFKPDRIVVYGHMDRDSGYDIFTIIDTSSLESIDTIWALHSAISPDGRMAAYKFFYSTHGRQPASKALIVYDFSVSPAMNRITEKSSWKAERGMILFPEKNRREGRYYYEEVETDTKEAQYYPSPIVWSKDSMRIATTQWEKEKNQNSLLIIDISKGLTFPQVTTISLDHNKFLQPYYKDTFPKEEYPRALLSFEELHFSEDGREVVLTSDRNGPFKEMTINVPVPSVE